MVGIFVYFLKSYKSGKSMLNILDFIKRNVIWLGSFSEIDRLAVYSPINGLYESGRYWLKEHSIVSDCVNKITSRRCLIENAQQPEVM